VEVHDEPELERALSLGAPIVGINARNLSTLTVDLAVIERMLPKVPKGVVAIAESGIATKEDVGGWRKQARAFSWSAKRW